MRRHALQIAAALIAFTIGFLTADRKDNLVYALPLALTVFLLTKVVPSLELDFHFLVVVALTLIMYSAGIQAFFTMLTPGGGDCVLYSSEADAAPIIEAVPQDTVITLQRTS